MSINYKIIILYQQYDLIEYCTAKISLNIVFIINLLLFNRAVETLFSIINQVILLLYYILNTYYKYNIILSTILINILYFIVFIQLDDGLKMLQLKTIH